MSIELQGVSKAFGEKQVLQNVSHLFPEGKLTCVMGPSGCGKTTLLSLLLGLVQPDAGEIRGMEGRKLSAIFQEDRLCENAGAVSNIRLVNPRLSKGEAEKMLREVGLGDSLGQPVRTLSGGMKRRVAILRALGAPYDTLLCDEPFKGLDEATKEQVIAYFQEKTRGKTVILVTHEKSEAQALGGELLLL